ncbi:hypothetical protein HELRODRAFT_165474 [Helobdella robusta]|uniref:Uncharacterized protein n=1 Tax=Helobdella robusta TaxID=6412 RepID=T1EWV4_HELRO|nr:hypothetical protein HELRODRAFT_165474 [Helobdella robusta]ESN91441.1 hypothetical protein HELRODRAFT_165474 [Helobdella robusta]
MEETKINQVIKSEILNYGENTSVRVISKFTRSKDAFLKLLWLVLLMGSTSYMIQRLYVLLSDYYAYPVTTQYGENVGQNIIFPDITICNLDPFASLKLDDQFLSDFSSKLKFIKNRFFEIIKDELNLLEKSALDVLNGAFEEMASVSGYLINLEKEYQQSDDCPNFIVDCSFFGTNWFETRDSCSIANFTRRWNPNYYSCYTMETKNLKTSNSNIIRGISLLLNVGPPNVIPLIYKSSLTSSQARGVQVSVHSPGTPPDLKRGFNVAPGTGNIVEIVQKERTRLKAPHNKSNENFLRLDCIEESSNSSKKYTYDLCREYCQQNELKFKSGCLTHLLFIKDRDLGRFPLCGNFSYYLNLSSSDASLNESIAEYVVNFSNSLIKAQCTAYRYNSKLIICYFSIKNILLVFLIDKTVLIKNDDCEKKCLMLCNEIMYQSFLTSATWPQPSIQLDIFQKYFISGGCMKYSKVKQRYINYFDYYNDILINNTTEIPLSSLTQMQKSLLEIKFVMKQNFPFFQSEKPAYTSDMMIGAVGGMLSLWLGVTVASGVEVIELVYLMMKRSWQKKFSDNEKAGDNNKVARDVSCDPNDDNQKFSDNTMTTKL